MKRILLPIFFFIFIYSGFAQTDTSFWFVAPEVVQQHGDRPIVLRFATSAQPAIIGIAQPANPSFPIQLINLPANSATTLDLTAWIDSVENKPADAILNRGIYIRSTAPITAYYEVNTACNCNPDIFTLKGRNALGLQFFVPFQNYLSNASYANSGFDIVATDNNTQITITPAQPIIGHPAGVPFTITLNRGQTYSAIATGISQASHLSGSTVTANKPIAVTIKDDTMEGTPYGGCADLMGDQIVPTNIIGTKHILIKGYLNGPDQIFILATQNGTQIQVDGVPVTTINAGQTYMHTLSNNVAYIETNLPVYVLHMTGFGCEVGGALVPTIECTGSQQIAFTRSTNEFFALNITVQAGGQNSFVLNGNPGLVPGSAFQFVPGTANQWMFAQIQFNVGDVPPGIASFISNGSHLFHMGIINGGASSGCRYGYFSDFSAFKFTASISADTLCEGQTLNLTTNPIPGATYNWTGPNNFSSGTQSISIPTMVPSQSGTYTITGSLGSCPIIADSTLIFVQPTPPLVNLSTNAPVCSGAQANIFADTLANATYAWTGPAGFTANTQNVSITGTPFVNNGTYQVTPSVFGCAGPTASIAIQFDSVHVVPGPSQAVLCFGGSTGIAVANTISSIGNLTYQWSVPAPSNDSLLNIPAGIYNVTVTDALNCSGITTIVITEPPALAMNLTATPATCYQLANGSIQTSVSGGVGGYGYAWTGAAVGANPTQLLAGMYVVTVTDNNGCTLIDSVQITEPSMLTGSVDSIIPISCFGYSDGSAFVSGQGGPGGYSYLWTPFGGSADSATQLSAGIYTVHIWDGGNCDTISVPVNLNQPPQMNVQASSPNPVICQGEVTSLQATGANQYTWQPVGNFSGDTLAQTSAAPMANETYTVIGHIGTCSDTATISITVHFKPTAAISAGSICQFDTLPFGALNSIVNIPDNIVQYDWDFDGNGTIDETTNQAVTTWYSNQFGSFYSAVIVTTNQGCKDTANITTNIYPKPVADFTPGLTCSNAPFTPTNTTNSFGFNVNIYLWTLGDGTQIIGDPISHNYLQTGTYEVTLVAQTEQGCADTIVKTIEVTTQPNVSIQITPGCFNQVQFEANTTPQVSITSWNWDLGDANQVDQQNFNYTYLQGGSYPVELIVTDPNGCTDTALQLVDVVETKLLDEIQMPNVITPNGDDVNDELTFDPAFEGCSTYTLRVFNRWGALVYETQSNSGEFFAGKSLTGSTLEAGTYFYVIESPYFSQKQTLTIIKP